MLLILFADYWRKQKISSLRQILLGSKDYILPDLMMYHILILEWAIRSLWIVTYSGSLMNIWGPMGAGIACTRSWLSSLLWVTAFWPCTINWLPCSSHCCLQQAAPKTLHLYLHIHWKLSHPRLLPGLLTHTVIDVLVPRGKKEKKKLKTINI